MVGGSVEKGWLKCSQSVRARNRVARENEKLVHKVVHRMASVCRTDYEDLYQIGYIGLLKAAERYDALTGNAFSSFAIPYIQGEIQHYLRDQWQTVKIPRTALETKARVKRLKKSLESLGRQVDELQVVTGLGLDESRWKLIDSLNSNLTISLDELIYEPGTSDEDPECLPLEEHLNNLPPNQKNAILEKFYVGKTIEKIARSQGVSSQEVKAAINIGLAKIRKDLLKIL